LISERLKLSRKSKNYTQKDVSEAIGVERATYTQYESGRIKPSVEKISEIADFLEVSTDYLFGRTDDPTPYREVDSDLDSSPDEELKQLLSDPQMRVAFLDYASWSDEDKRELVNFIKFKKSQRDGKEGK
jgi:transcriptional regulator with XRE-family HTH domain